MTELLWVQPGRDDGRVALSESDPRHPGGEAWVANTGQPVQVALTLAVERKLDSGDLVRCDPPKAVKEETRPKTKAEVDAMLKAAGGHVVDDKPTPQAGYLWTSSPQPDEPKARKPTRKAKGKAR